MQTKIDIEFILSSVDLILCTLLTPTMLTLSLLLPTNNAERPATDNCELFVYRQFRCPRKGGCTFTGKKKVATCPFVTSVD
jgi:hypothetical protein